MQGGNEDGSSADSQQDAPLNKDYPSDGDAVICRIREVEESIHDSEGKAISRSVDGAIEITNPSQYDRIWGVSLLLDEIESTSITEGLIKLREIQPSSNHRTDYTADPDPLMSIKEVLDTEPVRDEVPSLSLPFTSDPHLVKLVIEIENLGSEPLIDIEVTREIPPQWVFKPGLDYSLTDDKLVWRVPRLEINQKTALELEPEITISSVEEVESGEIVATYESPALISGLNPHSLRASTRHVSYVTATEGERPGDWGCVCSFENASTFTLMLESASMEVVGKEGALFSISGIKEIVKPRDTWKSQSVSYNSSDRPRFTQTIRSTVVPSLDVSSAGTIILQSKSLPVVDARIEKSYDRSRIKSYTDDSVGTTITVQNVGTSAINLLRLVDDLPPIFGQLTIDNLTVSIEAREIEAENMRLDLVDGRSLTMDESTGEGHTIQLLIGTKSPISLKPGEILKIRYPAITEDPSATASPIGSPCRVDLSSERHGPVITRECVRIPAIEVITRRREIKTGKSIFPGPEVGQHEILLTFNNTSDNPLEDVVLLDSITSNFELISSTVRASTDRELDVKHTSVVEGNTEIHRWSVGRVERLETIEVTALIESEDESANPEQSGSLGAEFGEEAELEPNLPRWFGEDGEWIHGTEQGWLAPVPICAICGGDIPEGALICKQCAESDHNATPLEEE